MHGRKNSLKQRRRAGGNSNLVVEHVQPIVGDGGHGVVNFLEVAAVQEGVEHGRLEDLDELQFASAFDLKAEKVAQKTEKSIKILVLNFARLF